ncbi:MAG: protein-methionine-sulfoxide reductase heme-binding subunit MsrQ [Pseudomonadota bacterium]
MVPTQWPWLKLGLWLLLSLPLAELAWRIGLELQQPTSGLGADPGEAIVHHLGTWALRILLLAFSVTPLRRTLRWQALGRARRLVGLFAFAYVTLHMLAYMFYYLQWDVVALFEDFSKRSYITVGIVSFLILAAMAVTSTRGWQRRLGRNWRRLHLGIYLAVALGLVHLWWLTRDGYAELLLYTIWFVVLLWLRRSPLLTRRVGSL